MSNTRRSEEDDSLSYFKLGQLYNAITKYFNAEEVDGILQKKGDINYRFPQISCFKNHQYELTGSTILHFAVTEKCHIDILQLLLDYGADYTIKNAKGLTALHQAVEVVFEKRKDLWKWISNLKNEYVAEILRKQVESRNSTNSVSSDGISHFHVACMTNHKEAVSFFLENGISVDQAVSTSSRYFPGYTPLHFAVRFFALETIVKLVEYKAKFDIQDARGMTPMHVAIERKLEILDLVNEGEEQQHQNLSADKGAYGNIIQRLLSCNDLQHSNFIDSIGLTGLHVACTMKDMSIAETYLRENSNVTHFIKFDSPVWPGFTALHFAALCNVKIVQLLLENGANIKVKDARGISPFDICLESYNFDDMHSILSKIPIWKDILFSDGKTRLLDIILDISTSNSGVKVDNTNIFIPFDSSLWPGYTPLHVAVIFADRIKVSSNYIYTNDYCYTKGNKLVKIFEPQYTIQYEYLAEGAALNVKDASGSTPLHLAFRLEKLILVKRLIEGNDNDIINCVNNDNLSHLHIAAAVNDVKLLTKLLKDGAIIDMQVQATYKYLNSQACKDEMVSYIIPKGSTALHIAAAGNNYDAMSVLLKYGANVYTRDVNGMTPIHRRLTNQKYVKRNQQEILEVDDLKNCIDDHCNFSHLHVASFFNLDGQETAELLLDQGADVNAAIKCANPSNESLQFLTPYDGFTPFHFALKNGNLGFCEILVGRGADIFAKSANGIPMLYEEYTSKSQIENYSLEGQEFQTENSHIFLSILEENENFRKRMFGETGLTMLHLVCYDLDPEWENFGRWLYPEDINARSHDNSPLWPDCTPLDILIKKYDKYKGNKDSEDYEWIDTLITEGFLINGADVTLMNGSNTTALLEIDRLNRAFKEEIICSGESEEMQSQYFDIYDDYEDRPMYDSDKKKIKVKCTWNRSSRDEDERIPHCSLLQSLFSSQKNFNINPVNAQGISHFHVACLNKFYDVVEKFLKHNVNMNSAVSLFSDEFPGCTPLHLTMIHRVDMKLTQLLLNYGANVNACDVYGNTPLHFAAKNSLDIQIFEMIINKGADINAKNSFGETPLNIILNLNGSSNTVVAKLIDYFVKPGFRVNSFNPVNQEGWIAKALCTCHKNQNINATIIGVTNLMQADDFGRTAIHNVASYPCSSTKGINLLKELAKHGCNVNHRDYIGRSALHIAVQFGNVQVVTELLKLGADINLKDSNVKVPFAYCFKASELISLRSSFNKPYWIGEKYRSIIKIFVEQISKLEIAELDVCQENREILNSSIQNIVVDCSCFREQLEKSKEIVIKYYETSFKLYDLLSELKIVAAYPNFCPAERQAINKFFTHGDVDKVCEKLDELNGLFKLQFKKAVEREGLVRDASKCLNLLGGSELSSRITERITISLSNMELKNLIVSVG